MKIEIDRDALDASFREGFPEAKEHFLAKQQAAKLDVVGLGMLDQLDDYADTFCEAWPRSRRFITMAIKGMGIFFPAQVGLVQGILKAVDEVIVPAVCRPKS